VHKLLAAVVDSKGLRLMNNHRLEQETFRYIKQNTNLSDINRMLERMESQDTIYHNLLTEITELENELQLAEE
jgi:hypothetical protein